ncbi:hypothetical protein ACFVJH_34515, partial [Streptomyces decoyicus]|uniref:hypothetical protein n=1 Tax=Streptomyces decoyicus TaxID=249567 RepID=UPI003628D6FE
MAWNARPRSIPSRKPLKSTARCRELSDLFLHAYVGGIEDRTGEIEQAGVIQTVLDLFAQSASDAGRAPASTLGGRGSVLFGRGQNSTPHRRITFAYGVASS